MMFGKISLLFLSFICSLVNQGAYMPGLNPEHISEVLTVGEERVGRIETVAVAEHARVAELVA